MNSVKYYRDLLADERRIQAFRRAIGRVVQPGDTVLDVGTALGTFAFFAADAGAKRVWGVDGHPIVHVAHSIARVNGYADRVEFIRGWLPQVSLPDRADVVIFEDFPPRFMNRSVWQILHSVRRRYAVSDCRVIPCAARLFVAPVSWAPLWTELSAPDDDDGPYGIDWHLSREYVMNSPADVSLPPEALVAQSAQIGTIRLDQATPETGPCEDASWTLDRDAVVHGLAYWFDLELDAEDRLSNAPGSRPGSWRHVFLPLDPPIEVVAGETLVASVRAPPDRDGAPGWLAWDVRAGNIRRRGHEFAAFPAALADVAGISPDGVPRLDSKGRVDARVLALTDGRRTLADIANALVQEGWVQRDEAEWFVANALLGRIEGAGLSALRSNEVIP